MKPVCESVGVCLVTSRLVVANLNGFKKGILKVFHHYPPSGLLYDLGILCIR